MPFERTTKVEELDRSKPGLRQLVDLLLDARRSYEEIAAKVEETFGEKVAHSTLSSYKVRRWQVQKKRVESIKNHAEAIMQLLEGGRAISDVQQAMLFEQVQSAMDEGKKLDPQFALREQRLWADQQLRREQLEQQKKELELKLEGLERQRQKERQEVEAAVGDAKDPAATIERIREIYGLAN